MPRYFFEVRSEKTVYDDRTGQVYPHEEAALRGGQRLAVELAEETTGFNGSTVVVLDEEGRKIGEFAIRPPDKFLQ